MLQHLDGCRYIAAIRVVVVVAQRKDRRQVQICTQQITLHRHTIIAETCRARQTLPVDTCLVVVAEFDFDNGHLDQHLSLRVRQDVIEVFLNSILLLLVAKHRYDTGHPVDDDRIVFGRR